MTTTGRTYWWAKDSAWWRREHIVELGEEFGAEGPAIIDWISCEAKAQNDGGWVKTGYKSVARGSFVDVVTVRHVVSRAVTLGLLDEFEADEPRFQCRISGWNADQQRARAAVRQAVHRDRKAENAEDSDDAVTPCHVPSRPVTLSHVESPTGTGTGEKKRNPLTPKGGTSGLLPPMKPNGNRGRDLDAYWDEMGNWVAEHFPGCATKSVSMVAGAIRAEGRQPTPDAIRAFAEEHPNFATLLQVEAA